MNDGPGTGHEHWESAKTPASAPGAAPVIDLSGRVAVVTGAAGAIGSAVMRQFSAAGAHACGLDIRAGDHIAACDVTSEESVTQVLAALSERDGVTDLVHCAGVAAIGAVTEMSSAEIRRVLDVNLVSSFIAARAVVPYLRPGAVITFLGSQAAIHGAPQWAAYCAAKAGVLRLTEALAKELGPQGIRVNAVCPGSVDSPMTGWVTERLGAQEGLPPAQVRVRYERGNPLGRMATPEEIARVCLFLSSPLANYVNGAAIMVDGGERPG